MANRQKLLRAMLSDERRAPSDYRKLKAKLNVKRDKKIIAGIIKDEQSHYQKIKRMLKGGKK